MHQILIFWFDTFRGRVNNRVNGYYLPIKVKIITAVGYLRIYILNMIIFKNTTRLPNKTFWWYFKITQHNVTPKYLSTLMYHEYTKKAFLLAFRFNCISLLVFPCSCILPACYFY